MHKAINAKGSYVLDGRPYVDTKTPARYRKLGDLVEILELLLNPEAQLTLKSKLTLMQMISEAPPANLPEDDPLLVEEAMTHLRLQPKTSHLWSKNAVECALGEKALDTICLVCGCKKAKSSCRGSIRAFLNQHRLFGQSLDRFPPAEVNGKKTSAWSKRT